MGTVFSEGCVDWNLTTLNTTSKKNILEFSHPNSGLIRTEQTILLFGSSFCHTFKITKEERSKTREPFQNQNISEKQNVWALGDLSGCSFCLIRKLDFIFR